MANPFTTIQQLLNYISANWQPNGSGDITGEVGNNVVNSLAQFIVSYTFNSGGGKLVTTGGNVILDTPLTVISTTVPSSLQWPDNTQNAYCIVNGTGGTITLSSGWSYLDQNLYVKTAIPAHFVLHIMKMQNGSWVQINNSTNDSIDVIVDTYPDMIAASTGTKPKTILVKSDSQKGIDNTIYKYWPDVVISWIAAVDEVNLT